MENSMEKLRIQIENERIFLNVLAEDNLHSEKTLAQSRLVDDLIARLYENRAVFEKTD